MKSEEISSSVVSSSVVGSVTCSVELVAVFVQTIILVGQQDAALELGFVDAAVVDRDFCRCAGVKGVQQL